MARTTDELRIVATVLLVLVVAVTVLSLIGVNVDLALAKLLHDPVKRRFLGENNYYFTTLRENGRVAVFTCIAIAAFSAAKALPWLRDRGPKLLPRAGLALTLAMILGPGLLVNGLLKPYGGRPRPTETSELGGPLPFVDWWDWRGLCDGNCSFASGEAATAAWMFGPALLFPRPWRGVAIGAAAAFTLFVSVLRMAAGGHFLSDVLFGVLSTVAILLALRRWIEPPSAGVPSSPGTRRTLP